MTDQKNDETTNDDLLGADPQAEQTPPPEPQAEAKTDDRPSVVGDAADEPDDLPEEPDDLPEEPEERVNPLPDAPVLDGKMVGDPDYPYDMVMAELNREAGQLVKHSEHLKRVSAMVLRYKARFAKRMPLSELNRRTREATKAIDDQRAETREKIIALMAEAGMGQ